MANKAINLRALFSIYIEGYCPLTIAKMLKSKGIFVSRRGVAKFYQEYTYLFALAGPRVAKHVKETIRTTYAHAYTHSYQKTETRKLKRNGNTYGTGRFVHRPFNSHSIPVQYPFAARFLCFFNGRPLYG